MNPRFKSPRVMVGKSVLIILGLIAPFASFAFEVLAIGTSATNCRNANETYTRTLDELLRRDYPNAKVINQGINGDVPLFMLRRLDAIIKPETKLVLFEPGPNETNPSRYFEPLERVLLTLQHMKMPAIYVSSRVMESEEEAAKRAKKYGAYYYGHGGRNIPLDHDHRQFDKPYPPGGHMTAKGCALWAQNIYPLIREVIGKEGIK